MEQWAAPLPKGHRQPTRPSGPHSSQSQVNKLLDRPQTPMDLGVLKTGVPQLCTPGEQRSLHSRLCSPSERGHLGCLRTFPPGHKGPSLDACSLLSPGLKVYSQVRWASHHRTCEGFERPATHRQSKDSLLQGRVVKAGNWHFLQVLRIDSSPAQSARGQRDERQSPPSRPGRCKGRRMRKLLKAKAGCCQKQRL